MYDGLEAVNLRLGHVEEKLEALSDNLESLRISREARLIKIEHYLGDISIELKKALKWVSIGGVIVVILLSAALVIGVIGWFKP